MTTEAIKKIFKMLYSISNFPITYFKNDYFQFEVGLSYDEKSASSTNPFLSDHTLFPMLITENRKEGCLLRNEEQDNDIYYGIFQNNENITCVVGPLSIHPLTPVALRSYIKRHHILNAHDFFICTSAPERTATFLSLLSYLLSGELPEPIWKEDKDFNQSASTILYYKLQGYQLNTNELPLQHFPYRMEQDLASCIREANLEKAFHIMKMMSSNYSTGVMANTFSKQEEYSAVIGVASIARIAIEGGMNPYDAYAMSDLYLQEISRVKSFDKYYQILYEAVREYIKSVKMSKAVNNQSMHVQKCKNYIAKHLNCPFSMSELADYVKLSPNYLSELFAKTEHLTIKEYTLREKIHAAKNMLKFSDYSISQIGEYFCFHSQSHFGQIFKRITGETPAVYRKHNKVQGF